MTHEIGVHISHVLSNRETITGENAEVAPLGTIPANKYRPVARYAQYPNITMTGWFVILGSSMFRKKVLYRVFRNTVD